MWTIVFSFCFAFYTYLGYPILLWLLGFRTVRNEVSSDPPRRAFLLVSVYNEAGVLPAKIENCLLVAENSPCPLSIWLISDGSDDGSDEIMARAARKHSFLRYFRTKERAGKNAALNQALSEIRPEPDDLLVFSDANSMYEPDALGILYRAVASGAGFAVGALAYEKSASGAAQGEGLYWRYESLVKTLESRLRLLTVANGGIFAVQAAYFRPLSPYSGNDLLLPLEALASGGYGVYAPEAVAYERAGDTVEGEFRRHRRIANRSLFGLSSYWGRLSARHRLLFLSHKVCRWVMLLPQALAFAANIVLLPFPLFQGLFLMQALFYACVFAGFLHERRGGQGPLVALYSLNMLHFAAFCGVLDFFSGRFAAHWEPIRRENGGAP